MELKDFLYDLPADLIAAYPSEDRTGARLMVVERGSKRISHTSFGAIGEFLRAGDLLVFNDTRVIPARLRGVKESGGKAEVLLIESFPKHEIHWMALVRSAKPPRLGSRILFSEGISAEVIGDMGGGRFGLRFHCEGDLEAALSRLGEPPLPPYIAGGRQPAALDRERYQTVYAASPGSIAAPTAGFHFTPELLEKLAVEGVDKAFVTLHVGPGTFRRVRGDVVENHRMDGERYTLSRQTAEKIESARKERRRVIAVGSTTVRTLEWVAQRKGGVVTDEGIARLFIHPGFRFLVVDGLITNFHLPASTPLLLAAAFAGAEVIRSAYEEAIREGYRFYSYGDAMLIV
ncbi:MAG: tRNA preQ1(34) S-adenosylmethionine ribosyltransferase-isomerase QueA [Candidatus Binatia bacterium]